jgi:mycothiol synthase
MSNDESPREAITTRTPRGEEDFWLVRDLLIDAWSLMPPGFNWETRRWDGSYFHNDQPGWQERLGGAQSVSLWETHEGRLVGVVHPESGGDAWLEVHRDFRHLEGEMLTWAEEHLTPSGKDGDSGLRVFAWEYDEERQQLLRHRGYSKSKRGEVLRRKPCAEAAKTPLQMPSGYRLHAVRPGHPEDCRRYAELLNAAFGRTSHKAQEIATFTTKSPSFRSDLELVVMAPDGSFAALAGMIYDKINRFGYFEPVCATPEPHPLGLTGTLMLEGHRRACNLGAECCYVGTGIGMPANRFYEALGFDVISVGWVWEKSV